MFRQSAAESPTKRTPSKTVPNSKRHAAARPAASPKSAVAYVDPPLRSERETAWIGEFVRKSAANIVAEIEKEFEHFGAFLEAVDGHDQAGLHSLNIAHSGLGKALKDLRRAVATAKVRGEAGYADE